MYYAVKNLCLKASFTVALQMIYHFMEKNEEQHWLIMRWYVLYYDFNVWHWEYLMVENQWPILHTLNNHWPSQWSHQMFLSFINNYAIFWLVLKGILFWNKFSQYINDNTVHKQYLKKDLCIKNLKTFAYLFMNSKIYKTNISSMS